MSGIDQDEYEKDMTQPMTPVTCGKPAFPHIAGSSYYSCVLVPGHKGDCKPGGTCFTHGEYVGEAGKAPFCPKCAAAYASQSIASATQPNTVTVGNLSLEQAGVLMDYLRIRGYQALPSVAAQPSPDALRERIEALCDCDGLRLNGRARELANELRTMLAGGDK